VEAPCYEINWEIQRVWNFVDPHSSTVWTCRLWWPGGRTRGAG